VIKDFAAVTQLARKAGKRTIAVADAAGAEVLEALQMARAESIGSAILVGVPDAIHTAAHEAGIKLDGCRIEPVTDPKTAAARAVELCRTGEADVLMKGMTDTTTFLGAVLDDTKGLRTGAFLSHIVVLACPAYPKLMWVTDGGFTPHPTYEQKVEIVRNALAACRKIGIAEPRVAPLCGQEKVHPRQPETEDADKLRQLGESGELGPCIVAGPTAMDVALSFDAAHHKGVQNPVAGDTDIFLVPSMAAGNIAAKALIWLAGAQAGGVVVGAAVPIVLLSRADEAATKFNSIALCLALTA